MKIHIQTWKQKKISPMKLLGCEVGVLSTHITADRVSKSEQLFGAYTACLNVSIHTFFKINK